MTKKILTSFFLMAALLACTKEGQYGKINLSLEEPGDVIEVTKGSLSTYTTVPSASDFSLTIKNDQNTAVWSGKLSSYDTSLSYKAGSYSVTATFGTEGEEGFDKPFFSGSQSFNVNGNQTTNVTIPVSLSNSLVKLSFSDMFKKYFPDYSFTLTTGSGTEIQFPEGEAKAAFVEAYKFTLTGTMKSQAGIVKNYSKEYESLEPATCYTVKFDVSNAGGLSLVISFKDTVETVDLGDIELND